MNNSSPFGQSLQGSRSFQNNTQSAPQQMFGGFQPQQSFGGFGGGQGFGGFNPFQGGYGGGFQPQQQFNPFQGGYGGGFQPQGFGGGFNPMFGGIGGLGFNPMMGPQFGMPMQGFNPYQIQMMDKQRQFEQQQFNPYQQQFQPQQQVSAPWMPTITETPGFGDWQQKQKQWVDQTPEGISYTKANEALEAFKKANPNPFSYSEFFGGDPALRAQYAQLHGAYQKAASPYFNKLNEYEKTNPFSPTAQQPQSPFTGPGFGSRLPMYGGIGGLGFNPMMGPQFGMPMQGMGGYGGFNPYQPPQQREQLLQDQRQFGYGQDLPQMQPKEDLSFEAFKASQTKLDPSFQQNHAYNPIELQYRSWLNKKITPDGNRQLLPGESPRQIISQADVNSIYDRYLESRRPNAQMSAPPLTADQKYQQAQQFGNQSYLYANSPAGRAAAAHFAMG